MATGEGRSRLHVDVGRFEIDKDCYFLLTSMYLVFSFRLRVLELGSALTERELAEEVTVLDIEHSGIHGSGAPLERTDPSRGALRSSRCRAIWPTGLIDSSGKVLGALGMLAGTPAFAREAPPRTVTRSGAVDPQGRGIDANSVATIENESMLGFDLLAVEELLAPLE
jgi:hypothetical protein